MNKHTLNNATNSFSCNSWPMYTCSRWKDALPMSSHEIVIRNQNDAAVRVSRPHTKFLHPRAFCITYFAWMRSFHVLSFRCMRLVYIFRHTEHRNIHGSRTAENRTIPLLLLSWCRHYASTDLKLLDVSTLSLEWALAAKVLGVEWAKVGPVRRGESIYQPDPRRPLLVETELWGTTMVPSMLQRWKQRNLR